MTRDELVKKIIPSSVDITPEGFATEELGDEVIGDMLEVFFDEIIKIHEADISMIEGFGEFSEEGILTYQTFNEFVEETFNEANEGYWFKWKEMFETTVLDKEIFYKYYDKMITLSSYCEDKRYLVNNNTFFVYMITDGQGHIGFPDWTRSGITDFLLDFVLMDLNKPELLVPERLYEYCQKKNIVIEDFKERFLCMAYLKGLDTLRWHASIDDHLSCMGITRSLSQLEERINRLY